MLENDINYAKKIINGEYSEIIGEYTQFRRIFPFSNENIKTYFDLVDFEDKDVLSVLASSDQVFDMFLRGTKSIDTFDINPLCKYYFYLKKAAILALEKNDFIDFFTTCKNNAGYYELKKTINKEMFSEITKYLKGDYLIFWDEIYKILNEYNLLNFYYTCHSEVNELVNRTLYLDDTNYKLLKKSINSFDIKFIECNFKNLYYFLDKKYDIMYFSNIADYLISTYKTKNYELIIYRYKRDIEKIKTFLNYEGIILMHYLYNYHHKDQTINRAILNMSNTKCIKLMPNETYSPGVIIHQDIDEIY